MDKERDFKVNVRFVLNLKGQRASLVAQLVKNPPAVRETWVQSLGWEDPLEEGMPTYSSILAWRIPMDREAWRATVHGVAKELDMSEQLNNNSVDKSWEF